MAKTQFKGNADKFLKKVEKDFQALGLAVGEGTTDWLALTFDDIQKKGFLDGRGSETKLGYIPVGGANIASRKNPKRMAFHKTKIVNRNDTFPQAFNKINYNPQNQNGRTVLVGSNGIANVHIEKLGDKKFSKGQSVEISFNGPIGDKLKNHEFGIGVQKRPIVWRGLLRMKKRWGKFIQAKADKAIRKRNRVKV